MQAQALIVHVKTAKFRIIHRCEKVTWIADLTRLSEPENALISRAQISDAGICISDLLMEHFAVRAGFRR